MASYATDYAIEGPVATDDRDASPVELALSVLSQAIDEIEGRVTVLQRRLAFVLAPQENVPQDPTAMLKQVDDPAPLVGRLRHLTTEASDLGVRLMTLTERLAI